MILYILSKILKKIRIPSVYKSSIDPSSKIEAGSSVINTNFARHSFCGYDCNIINADIGGFCSIANRVSVGGASHPIHFVSSSPVFLSHKDSVKEKFANHDYLPSIRTKIESDVWIGDGAFIKAGVSIGVGAVVGMGSVVTKDVPPYAIVAGNPARIIRYRFNKDMIDALIKSQWWNASDSELLEIGKNFDNPVEFLKSKGLL
jgi:acetyltransferase-like isoleucine patch superfamily enzyme